MSLLRIRLECATPTRRPGVARLQSLVRGYLARRLVKRKRLQRALARQHGFGVAASVSTLTDECGDVRVALSLRTRLALPPAAQSARHDPSGAHRPSSDKTRGVVVVTTAIVVGLVAMALLRNPAGARAAAATAAATVAALMANVHSTTSAHAAAYTSMNAGAWRATPCK